MFHKLRTPVAVIPLMVAPVAMAESDSKTSRKLRPSQLPLYEEPEEIFK